MQSAWIHTAEQFPLGQATRCSVYYLLKRYLVLHLDGLFLWSGDRLDLDNFDGRMIDQVMETLALVFMNLEQETRKRGDTQIFTKRL